MDEEAKPFRAKPGPKPLYFFRGDYRSLSYIAARLGVSSTTLRTRLSRGESTAEAFTGPRHCSGATNALHSVNGETLPLRVWAQRLGITLHGLRERLACGKWTVEEALTTPFIPQGQSRARIAARPRKVKLRLPAKPLPDVPGGYEQTFTGTVGTGGGRHAVETAYPAFPTKTETMSEAGQ